MRKSGESEVDGGARREPKENSNLEIEKSFKEGMTNRIAKAPPLL